ncbi:MAG: META domain-containing protein [Rhodobacteraceae bacterium CG17_big_fil_post_rev_8_21_14_2_50_63_15]|nr:META domain-containing protein [Roseovarius sp.]PIV80041.1 MAG: META domain-containing protein [Rhodobacteraceae bacterium CG17_big_fil_post_rev_8_21_14_2_50_63_15]
MRAALILAALTWLGSCRDETVTAYGGDVAIWRLESVDGTPYSARATLGFAQEGKLTGEAPCNSFSGTQTAPYPWFAAKDLITTRRTCPDLAAETLFFSALAEMTLVEVAGEVLILSNDLGREMVFHAGA